MVTTGTGTLLGMGKFSGDLILNLWVAIFFEGPPSSWTSSEDSLVPALGFFLFLEMTMVCSPVVMYSSLPTR